MTNVLVWQGSPLDEIDRFEARIAELEAREHSCNVAIEAARRILREIEERTAEIRQLLTL